MSEYLLVVEGLAEGGADAAMFVDEIDYRAAMFGCAFVEPVHGYVWCSTHGWVLADEACVCEACADALRSEYPCEYAGEIDYSCEYAEEIDCDAEDNGDWLIVDEPTGDVVEAGEPCACVFFARGAVDAQGVLHTARRLPVADGAIEPAARPQPSPVLITEEEAALFEDEFDQFVEREVAAGRVRLVQVGDANFFVSIMPPPTYGDQQIGDYTHFEQIARRIFPGADSIGEPSGAGACRLKAPRPPYRVPPPPPSRNAAWRIAPLAPLAAQPPSSGPA
jgi:hypothetical protein